jgi:hypothetical protein
MIEFRDRQAAELGVRLLVHTNTEALKRKTNPILLGTERCCWAAQDPVVVGCAGRGQLRRGVRRRPAR